MTHWTVLLRGRPSARLRSAPGVVAIALACAGRAALVPGVGLLRAPSSRRSLTGSRGARRSCSGGAPLQGVLLRHAASGAVVRLRGRAALRVVPRRPRRAGGPGRRLQRGYLAHAMPAGADGVRRRRLQRPSGCGRDGVRRRRRRRLPLRLGADDARHRGARRDRARDGAPAAAPPSSTSPCPTSGRAASSPASSSWPLSRAPSPSPTSSGVARGRRRCADVLFVLFLVGFGVKAGVIPLHVWLPEAHPAAPSSVSALMSGS